MPAMLIWVFGCVYGLSLEWSGLGVLYSLFHIPGINHSLLSSGLNTKLLVLTR